MLGIKRRVDVLQILRALVENGITVHTQIVLCPGWNDGEILEKSYRDLLELYPGVGSIAVVPVGLTAHRDSLTRLDPVTPELAARVIEQVARYQAQAHQRTDHSFIHLSDEFYLLAGADFPDLDSYGELPQVDNGIGLTVHLRDRWREDLVNAAAGGTAPRRPLTILTGRCAQLAFEREFLPEFARHGAPAVEVIGVENRFYGSSVTVAGLLAGRDLRRALLDLPADPVRTVLLSSRVFNSHGLTLDDMDLSSVISGSPHSVLVAPEEGFVDFWIGLD
jgi:NifB/MoaA-like Fe-S oxidoreductase